MPDTPSANPDNITSSSQNGPNMGNASGIAHLSIDNISEIPTGNRPFIERVDANFKKTLTSIGLMSKVIDRIEKKQDATIEVLKEIVEDGKTLDEKVDELQDTLDEMMDRRKKELTEEEKRRREEELEKRTAPSLISNQTMLGSGDKEENKGFGFSPTMWLGILAGATVLSGIGKMQPQINALLGFLRASSAVIASYSGLGRAASNSGATFGAFQSIMNKTGSGVGLLNSAAKPLGYISSVVVRSVLGVLKFLKRFFWAIMVIDPLITIGEGIASGADAEWFKKNVTKSLGRVFVGWAGAYWGSMLGGLVGSLFLPPAGTILGFFLGAVAGGYLGSVAGDLIGEALYELFGSMGQTYSKLMAIVDKIKKDLERKVEQGLETAERFVSTNVRAATDYVGLTEPEKSAPSPSPSNRPSPIPSSGSGGGGGGGNNSGVPGGPTNPTVSDRNFGNDYGGTPLYPDQTNPNKNYVPNSRDPLTWKTNNPGAIRGGDGTVKKRGGLGRVYDTVTNQYPNTGTLRYGTAEEGFCEQARLLVEYITGGKNTIRKIIKPYSGNHSAEGYTNHVSKYMGIGPDEILDSNDDNVLFGLMRSMINWEGGKSKRSGIRSADYWTDEHIWGGIKLYHQKYGKNKNQNNTPKPVRADSRNSTSSSSGQPGPQYGPGGSVIKDSRGSRYDKSGGTNEPALDDIIASLNADGLIPAGSSFSFNDAYHQEHTPNSKHTKGLALDIGLSSGGSASLVLARIKSLAAELGMLDRIFINPELTRPAGRAGAKWTGPHIHIAFNTVEDARAFHAAWMKKNRPQQEAVPSVPSSGQQLMSYKPEGGGTTIINNISSSPSAPEPGLQPKSKGGFSGNIPNAYNPNNRDILSVYT